MNKPTLEQTLQLVMDKHAGQLYNDEPYVFHLVRVASQVDGYEKKTIALLHDILEDTDIKIYQLLDNGYSKEIIKHVLSLTHNPKMPYIEYIQQLDELEREIKLADLLDHFNHIRKIRSNARKAKLLMKYIPAWDILNTPASSPEPS